MKKATLIFSVIVLILFGGLVYVAAIRPAQSPPTPQIPADWKTYRNEKYGIEFQYPEYIQSVALNAVGEEPAGSAPWIPDYQIELVGADVLTWQSLNPQLVGPTTAYFHNLSVDIYDLTIRPIISLPSHLAWWSYRAKDNRWLYYPIEDDESVFEIYSWDEFLFKLGAVRKGDLYRTRSSSFAGGGFFRDKRSAYFFLFDKERKFFVAVENLLGYEHDGNPPPDIQEQIDAYALTADQTARAIAASIKRVE